MVALRGVGGYHAERATGFNLSRPRDRVAVVGEHDHLHGARHLHDRVQELPLERRGGGGERIIEQSWHRFVFGTRPGRAETHERLHEMIDRVGHDHAALGRKRRL